MDIPFNTKTDQFNQYKSMSNDIKYGYESVSLDMYKIKKKGLFQNYKIGIVKTVRRLIHVLVLISHPKD